MTGSCTVHFKRDARVYERVQPRLPEVSRCKSALFRSPKGSQYQLVQVVSDTKLSQICCSAHDLLYIIRISRVTYRTNTDFSRDLLYKIRVFINYACVPGFPIGCCTLFKHRCMINNGNRRNVLLLAVEYPEARQWSCIICNSCNTIRRRAGNCMAFINRWSTMYGVRLN